jgi:hypothetical protein
MRNTHKTIAESLVTLGNSEIVDKNHKEVVAYLSMGFGNRMEILECRNQAIGLRSYQIWGGKFVTFRYCR